MTTILDILRWQWAGYARFHRSPANLLIHIVAVPVFMAGSVLLFTGLVQLLPWQAAGGAAALLVSMAAQGRGHRLEAEPAVPFAGPRDAIVRILLEQWVTFPAWVLSGGWRRR